MSKGLPQFMAAAAQADREVPEFIARELERYLECGHYEGGFAQVTCRSCGHRHVVGFSCKGRSVCPSCAGRRMADLSCHLVDRVLPFVPYRQFVITFPPPLRFMLAFDSTLLGKAIECFVRAVSHWQRSEAKRRYGLRGVSCAVTAAVTGVQRFGSALNLNLHLHSLFPDGVWEKRSGGLVFRKLGRPTADELRDIGWRTCRRLIDHLRRKGQWIDGGDVGEPHLDDEDFAAREPLLAEVYGASMRGRLALGPGRGHRVVVLRRSPNLSVPKDLVAAGPRGHVFDVHAAVSVARGDRRGLERLCRYLCRPAAGNERFEEREDGRVMVRLKTPWSDGTTHVVLTPLELVEKLVALIAPPRFHMVRYHGAFAPNAAVRASIVPTPATPSATGEDEPRCTHSGRQAYAMLMRRVFAVEIERCAKCGGRETTIRFVTEKDDIERVLRSIGYANAPNAGHAASA